MVAIRLAAPFALLIAVVGAVWIYIDARNRGMDTADMWAVGFFVGMFLPPIIGAVVVAVMYYERRDPRSPTPVSHHH